MTTATAPMAVGVPEAAKLLSVSRPHVYRAIKSGEIRAAKLGKRTLIPMSEIERVLANLIAVAGLMDNSK